MKTHLLILRLFLVLLLLTSLAAQTPRQLACSRLLSEKQVTDLVKSRVPVGLVVSWVNSCGLAFAPTDETLLRLKAAGVSSVILVSARRKGEEQAWDKAKNADDIPVLEAFLRIFPNGTFASPARESLRTLRTAAIRAEIRHAIELGRPSEARQKLTEFEGEAAEIATFDEQISALEEEQRKQALEARLAALRHKLNIEETFLPLPVRLSLAEARDHLSNLHDRLKTIDTRLKAEYATSAKADAVQSFSNDFDGLAAPYNEQIMEIKARRYTPENQREPIRLDLYDSDGGILVAHYMGYVYQFNLDRDRAKSILASATKLSIDGTFLDAAQGTISAPREIGIGETSTSTAATGVRVGMDFSGAWTSDPVWAGSCGGKKKTPVTLLLKSEGMRLTGSFTEKCGVGRFRKGTYEGLELQGNISDGFLYRDEIGTGTISFSVTSHGHEDGVKGVMSEGQLALTVAGPTGQVSFKLHRAR